MSLLGSRQALHPAPLLKPLGSLGLPPPGPQMWVVLGDHRFCPLALGQNLTLGLHLPQVVLRVWNDYHPKVIYSSWVFLFGPSVTARPTRPCASLPCLPGPDTAGQRNSQMAVRIKSAETSSTAGVSLVTKYPLRYLGCFRRQRRSRVFPSSKATSCLS